MPVIAIVSKIGILGNIDFRALLQDFLIAALAQPVFATMIEKRVVWNFYRDTNITLFSKTPDALPAFAIGIAVRIGVFRDNNPHASTIRFHEAPGAFPA